MNEEIVKILFDLFWLTFGAGVALMTIETYKEVLSDWRWRGKRIRERRFLKNKF